MKTVYAYVAGIIDGEGCISIGRRATLARGNGAYYYHASLIVVQRDRRLPEWLHRYFGGHLGVVRRTSGVHNGRPTEYCRWVLTGDSLIRVLTETRPYMVLKRRQAGLALRLTELLDRKHTKYGQGLGKRSDATLRRLDRLYWGVRRLNSPRLAEGSPTHQVGVPH
jgi:hypothetical protein